MSVWHHTSSGHLRSAFIKQLLTICLLGLGAGIIFWLSGGVPPHTWRVLLQMSLQLPMLWTQQGAGVLVPFFIVVVQSLLVGIAWAVFGWLAFRESSALFALLTSQRSGGSRRRSSSKKLITTSQTSRPALMAPASSDPQKGSVKKVFSKLSLRGGSKKQEEAASSGERHMEQSASIAAEGMSPFAPPLQEDWFLSTNHHDADSAAHSGTSDAIWAYEDERVKGPFEDEMIAFQTSVEHPSIEHLSMSASEDRQEYLSILPFDKPQPPTGVQQYYTMNTISTNPFIGMDDVEVMRSSIHEPYGTAEGSLALEEESAPCEDGDFAAALQNFGFLPHQDVMEMSARAKEQPAAPEHLPVVPPATNPFDVQEHNFSGTGENFVFGTPFMVQEQPLSLYATEPSIEHPVREQAPAQPPSEHGFIFGNPLDGPLPEVFEHDEELKQSIAEQREARLTGPFSSPEEESDKSDDKQVKRKRSRGKRGKGTAQANQNAPGQANQEE